MKTALKGAALDARRIPTCPESHRVSIDEFLQHLRARVERTLNDYRATAMQHRDASTIGMVNYKRTQLSVLTELISINQQRRKAPGRGDA